ncbi:glycoside hydrolase family 108 protein [Ancylobacter mangrovi]|uniref:glycoside hydrolase family 108 protein n=1 Tax=Ancylobacter mangrovi TaxID=2972472 RepID=UPI0021629422|nr:glycoside hydrolase family 108 protein [Ancylobacter mangrovi]MCS0501103.1 glycoside hydrolase family 108 protein [Ancylobacter mangrovi]
MTASSFDEALKRVLVHEGGYADLPADPGGATMKGITQRVYNGWRRRRGLAARSVRRIGDDEVTAIYRAQYWDAIRGDDLPAGVDYCVFDAAVNSGPAQAAKWLQRAVGAAADGIVGEATLSAVRAAEPVETIDAVCDRRLAMLRGLKTFRTFGAGWTRRVAEVRETAAGMARGSTGRLQPPAVVSDPSTAAKARPSDLRLGRTREGAGGLIAGTGGLAAIIAEQADRLAPLAGVAEPLKWTFAALMLAGVALTLHAAMARIRAGESLA